MLKVAKSKDREVDNEDQQVAGSAAGHVAAKREMFGALIAAWCEERRLADALSRREIANLDSFGRLLAQQHSLIDNYGHYFATAERADVALGVLLLVTLLCDNPKGCCTLSIPRIAQFYSRSERAISEAIARLETAKVIFVKRSHHKSSSYWPVINRGLGGQKIPPLWFVDARSPPRANGRPRVDTPEPDSGGFSETPRTRAQNPPLSGSPNLTIYSACKKEAHADFDFVDGKLRLFNGERLHWVEKFGGADALESALIQAAGYLKPDDGLAQVRSRLETNLCMRRDGARRTQQRRAASGGYVPKGSAGKGGGVHDTGDNSNDPKRFKTGDPEFVGEIARLRHDGDTELAGEIERRGWVKLKPRDAELARDWAHRRQPIVAGERMAALDKGRAA